MYCQLCRAPIPDLSRFCDHCGAEQPEITKAPASPPKRSSDLWTPSSPGEGGQVGSNRTPANNFRFGRFFMFEGRIGRGAYWGSTITGTAVVAGSAALFNANTSRSVVVAGAIVGIVAWWVCLAAAVKRWHDRNKSGGWVFIALIPLVGAVWALVETGFLEGTSGENTYGWPSGGSPFGDQSKKSAPVRPFSER
jgi:uncharacterized membrane protein YhaH (DUF805 family)